MAKKQAPEKVETKTEAVEEVKSPEKVETKKVEVYKGDYKMIATHLSWGANNKNHFYSEKKPLINAKVMGKYAKTLELWLKNGWIEKGSYEE